MTIKHTPRRFGTLTLLGLVLLLFGSMPAQMAMAAVTVQRAVDNTSADFSKGTFQRTTLSPLQTSVASRVPDLAGAVQLSPIGLLKNWQPASTKTLPNGLSAMGTAALGNRIYVIGGLALIGNQTNATDKVYSAQVSLETGAIADTGWEAETSLVAAQASNSTGFTDPTAPISSPGVFVVPNSGGGGYIFVVGGATSSITFDGISSFAVRRATVNSDGHITSPWVEIPGARLVEGSSSLGVQSPVVQTLTVRGKTYAYVVGGLQRFNVGTGGARDIREIGSRDTLYAEVRDGKLYKPGTSTEGWTKLDRDTNAEDTELPLPGNLPTDAGLWNAAGVIDSYPEQREIPELAGKNRALYVIGGQLTPNPSPQYSSEVYVALIDNNGKPNWLNVTFALGGPRIGHGAVTFRGNHYVTGGITNFNTNEPTRDVLTTFVNDDLSLEQFIDNTNFLRNEDVLPNGRAFHGSVVVPASTAGQSGSANAFVYVIGGRGPNNRVFDDVIIAKIGQDEEKANGFAPSGFFYSKPYRINFNNAEVREIGWATQITGDAANDIEMEYRISRDNDCDQASWTQEDWRALDGAPNDAAHRSVNGSNGVAVGSGLTNVARCFQYRAKIIGGGPASAQGFPTETSSLLNVGITIVIPGSPDLRADKPGDIEAVKDAQGRLAAFNVRIRNQSDVEDPPTLDVDAEQRGGSFFIDLYVFKEGDAITKPVIPVDGAASLTHIACASVSKSTMVKDAVLQISEWVETSNDTDCKPNNGRTNVVNVLNKIVARGAGRFTVYVVVDSTCGPSPAWGCVDEREKPGGEDNNVTQYQFDLTNATVVYQQRVPVVYKR